MNSTKYDLYPLNSSTYSFTLQQDKKIEEIEKPSLHRDSRYYFYRIWIKGKLAIYFFLPT